VQCARARWYEVDAVVEQSLAALADIVAADSVEVAWDDDGTDLRTGTFWTRRPDTNGPGRHSPHFESLFGAAALGRDLLCFSSDLASLAPNSTRDLLVRGGTRAVVEARVADEPVTVLRLCFGRDWMQWDDANIDLVALLVTGLLSTLRRCRAEAALQERARRDPLTGLLNREELYRILEGHLALADPGSSCLGVLYGDLDRFKEVNDALGHAAGDRVLLGVAAALGAHTRDGDAVARFGGDEFVVVCPHLDDAAQLRRIAERVEAAVRRLAPEGIPVGVSFGVAIARPGMDADELIHLADRAMYARKRRKRRSRDAARS
jgi:diguanylate cyclase (GGDEF)-like protein